MVCGLNYSSIFQRKIVELGPQLAVEHAVVNRFMKVLRRDGIAAGQVGNGSGYAKHFVVSPGGKTQISHGRSQKIGARFIELAMLANLPMGHVAVASDRRARETLLLCRTSLLYLLSHFGAGRPRMPVGQFFVRDRWHFDVNINPIDERTADLRHVAFNLRDGAMAISARVVAVAARARIEGRDQHEVGREGGAGKCTADCNHAVFKRLAKNFERRPIEFG